MNLFDIMGPVMVGPSSSHTAGAVRIGRVARLLLQEALRKVKLWLHGSFADTGKGHGTYQALIAGLLGLVCDPVGGLVEVPCVKRNVIGTMNALSAAQMALAGIESRVPPDQVLDAMRAVGQSLPAQLRETGRGGLAATPFGLQYRPRHAEDG